MRSVVLTVGLLMLLAVSSVATEPANVLIVDRTQSFMESMQVEVLARVLLSSELFTIGATMEIPKEPHPLGPFQFVIIIPPGEPWVWVCIPGLPGVLPEGQQRALAVLKGSIEQVFTGERKPADPADDLYPLFWSAYFLNIGILEGVN
ncbi:hypothetical protein KAX17_10050 [Candidatus Bipolaricaulota bacterium]|nr:hypothetical protein [Candidatus Bipolaricaulota bacterium]